MPLKKPYEVSSWAELQDILFHDTYNAGLNRIRSPYIYRGLSDIKIYFKDLINSFRWEL